MKLWLIVNTKANEVKEKWNYKEKWGWKYERKYDYEKKNWKETKNLMKQEIMDWKWDPTKVIENETKWNWQNQTKWKRQNKTMKMTKQKSQLEMKCNGKLKLKQEDTKRSPMKAQEKWIRRAKMNPRYFCIINEIWPRKEIKNEY